MFNISIPIIFNAKSNDVFSLELLFQGTFENSRHLGNGFRNSDDIWFHLANLRCNETQYLYTLSKVIQLFSFS